MKMNSRTIQKISFLAVVLAALSLPALISSCTSDPAPQVVTPPLKQVFYDWRKVVVGADLSSVNMVEAQGAVYKDSGVVQDPYTIFKTHGCNMVRLRLFKDPSATGGYNADGYGGIDDVIVSMQRAKAAGIAVTLDLHFPDTWADPGQQKIPVAWQGLGLTDLRDSVYNYVTSVLTKLQNRNLLPDMIQIGNEVQSGMLFPLGKIESDNDFTDFVVLLQAGIKAVREFSIPLPVKPLIIIHPGKPEIAEYFFNKILTAGVTDYDVAAISYYDNYTTQKFADLSETFKHLKNITGKKVLIAETSYQWTDLSQDGKVYNAQTVLNGFFVTRGGQYDYMVALTQVAINAGGMGVIYWEPAWVGNNVDFGHETIAFFDYTDRTIAAMNYFNYPYEFPN